MKQKYYVFALDVLFLYSKRGLKNDGINYLYKAVEIEYRNPEALSSLGESLIEIGNFTQAEVYLQTAIEVSPDFFEAYTRYAYLLSKTSKCDNSFVLCISICIDIKRTYFLNILNDIIIITAEKIFHMIMHFSLEYFSFFLLLFFFQLSYKRCQYFTTDCIDINIII
jgi:tetratricopeptide (TPR) repeat protein